MYAAPLKVWQPKYISLTGIILGSMGPDFEYFIALEPYQSIGHSTQGLIFQVIPLSLLLAFVFHYLIKRPLSDHLPSWFNLDIRAHGVIRDWQLDKLRSWIVFIFSVIIGFYSHILLDAFTHKSGLFVTRVEFLQESIIGIPVYKILQHSLSIVGLIVEVMIVGSILQRTQVNDGHVRLKPSIKIQYWIVVFLSTLITISLKFFFSTSTNGIGMLVVSSISGFFIGIVISSVIYKLRFNNNHNVS